MTIEDATLPEITLTDFETSDIAQTFHNCNWLSPERAECIERVIAERVAQVTGEHSPGETCEEADERAADNWQRAETERAARLELIASLETQVNKWDAQFGPFPNGFQYDLPIRGDRGVVTVLQALLQAARTEEPTA